ncbi:uncharacterized protein LOC143460907 [Clavelina lepadiformis]|uniref:uncharacterized protein LOC143460907 n=1 Tax=Clavelina lepadiformis TaxID=159417 RepID=UPI00404198B9
MRNLIIIILSLVILVTSTEVQKARNKTCKGPRVRRWKVEDFRLNVTWTPRKCFSRWNVTYDIETSIYRLDKNGWVKRSCEVENYGRNHSCTPMIKFYQDYFYRVCAYEENDQKVISCTRFPPHKRKIDLRIATSFSKPKFTVLDVSPTSIAVNIKEPTGSVLCEYERLDYEVYVIPCNANETDKIAQRRNISDTDSKNPSCNKDGANVEKFEFFHLKPERDYCIYGRYSTDVSWNNRTSPYASQLVKTKPVSNTGIVVGLICACGFVFFSGLIISCMAFRRIRKTDKTLTPKLAEAKSMNSSNKITRQEDRELADIPVITKKSRNSTAAVAYPRCAATEPNPALLLSQPANDLSEVITNLNVFKEIDQNMNRDAQCATTDQASDSQLSGYKTRHDFTDDGGDTSSSFQWSEVRSTSEGSSQESSSTAQSLGISMVPMMPAPRLILETVESLKKKQQSNQRFKSNYGSKPTLSNDKHDKNLSPEVENTISAPDYSKVTDFRDRTSQEEWGNEENQFRNFPVIVSDKPCLPGCETVLRETCKKLTSQRNSDELLLLPLSGEFDACN